MDLLTNHQNETSPDIELELEYEIEEDIEAELEDFVRLNHTGQFEDALELFDECLSSHDDWYPIAAEYADCLLRQGKFKQLADFSRKASMTFQDPGEKMLLRLMGVIGNLDPRDVMRQQLQALWPIDGLKPPYTSLKDTDIHILELMLLALVLTELEPKDLEASLTSDAKSVRPWNVFKYWFYHLLHNQLFWEAQRILQSLLHIVSWTDSRIMVHDYIEKAVSTNIGKESVQIAVSSLVQRFIYVNESRRSSPLAVVPWNDAITWAILGVTLAKTSGDTTSPFKCITLRRSLQEKLAPHIGITLPLDSVRGNDEISDSLYEAVSNGDVSMMRQAIVVSSTRYGLDEVKSTALPIVARHCSKKEVLVFLDSDTVHARDGYQRTALHWAAIKGDRPTIDTLLIEGADPGSLDWFGRTPLHYAVKTLSIERYEAANSILNFDAATVNTKDLSGLGPLHTAILDGSHDIATLLVQYGAIMETSDIGALPPFDSGHIDWGLKYSLFQITGNPSDARTSTKTFGKAGYDTESIEKILKREGKGKNVEDLKVKDLTRPTYIKVHQKHLSPDTLDEYNLPWEWDPRDTNYIIIKQWIPEGDHLILFEHTKNLKERKPITSSLISPKTPLASFQPSDQTLPGAKHGALSKRPRSSISDGADFIRSHSPEKSSSDPDLLPVLRRTPRSPERNPRTVLHGQHARQIYPPTNAPEQNPPCNTLYVGSLPADTSEDELKDLFSKQKGYKRLCFRTKQNGPMCFVEFEDVSFATKALQELDGHSLHNSTEGGIRLSFSKNPLGVRAVRFEAVKSSETSFNPFESANDPPPGSLVPSWGHWQSSLTPTRPRSRDHDFTQHEAVATPLGTPLRASEMQQSSRSQSSHFLRRTRPSPDSSDLSATLQSSNA